MAIRADNPWTMQKLKRMYAHGNVVGKFSVIKSDK